MKLCPNCGRDIEECCGNCIFSEPQLIRLAMSALGKRPKTMSEAALRQRKIAGQKSVEARRQKKVKK